MRTRGEVVVSIRAGWIREGRTYYPVVGLESQKGLESYKIPEPFPDRDAAVARATAFAIGIKPDSKDVVAQ